MTTSAKKASSAVRGGPEPEHAAVPEHHRRRERRKYPVDRPPTPTRQSDGDQRDVQQQGHQGKGKMQGHRGPFDHLTIRGRIGITGVGREAPGVNRYSSCMRGSTLVPNSSIERRILSRETGRKFRSRMPAARSLGARTARIWRSGPSRGTAHRQIAEAAHGRSSQSGTADPCRPTPLAKRLAPASVSPEAIVTMPRRSSLTIAACQPSSHCSIADSRSLRMQV